MRHTTKSKKRIGVFDRWFFRMGGGEQMVCSTLRALKDAGHTVELLTIIADPTQRAADAFGIDLNDISVRLVDDVAPEALSEITKEYDVFINASHLDYIPNQAPIGILLIFFPAKPISSIGEYIKRSIAVPLLQKVCVYPKRTIGLHQNNELSDETTLSFSHNNLTNIELEFHFPAFAFSVIDQLFFTSAGTVLHPTRQTNVRTNTIFYGFDECIHARDKGITIHLPKSKYAQQVTLESIRLTGICFRIWQIFAKAFPTQQQRLLGGPAIDVMQSVQTYTHRISISDFTSKWIWAFWNKKSNRIYPPVQTEALISSQQKKQWITHVGRFFTGSHSKHQLELVRAFKKLVDAGAADWELHCIGQTSPERIHQEYLIAVQAEARGYPVVFHLNASRKELEATLSASKLYWHATGIGDSNPETTEHFGISIIEAMASGCVPLVYDNGAAREIISTESGVLYSSIEELVDQTSKLMNNPTRISRYSAAAIERSHMFSQKRYAQEIISYVENAYTSNSSE